MIHVNTFSHLPDGREMTRYSITNGKLTVRVLNYGATIQSIVYDGVDVVNGYDDTPGYLENSGYVGATIGRFGNRIADGTFVLNGKTYAVGANEKARGNHLHGGFSGFDKQMWNVEFYGDNAIRLNYISPDGENGYPGRLDVSVTMTVTDDSALELCYHAVSDKDTILNLTNHTYFNLNGFDGGDVLNTLLTIRADAITPVDEKLIPTGEQLSVAGTPFDFRTAKPIGQDIDADDPQLKLGGGYDHNFVFSAHTAEEPVITAHSPKTGITMDCLTDQPGVQLYTANFLNANAGKNGIKLYRHQGFCLETQHFPDSPHHPAFPSTVLHAGEHFESTTTYRFRGR